MSKISHMKKVIEYLNVRQEVSDEVKTSIPFIKDEVQNFIENHIS